MTQFEILYKGLTKRGWSPQNMKINTDLSFLYFEMHIEGDIIKLIFKMLKDEDILMIQRPHYIQLNDNAPEYIKPGSTLDRVLMNNKRLNAMYIKAFSMYIKTIEGEDVLLKAIDFDDVFANHFIKKKTKELW